MNTKNQDNYELVFEHDRQAFLSINPEQMIARTGTFLSDNGLSIQVPMLNQNYLVSLKTGLVSDLENIQHHIPVNTRLLILHYLIYSREQACIVGTETPFHSIRGISHFYAAFLRDTTPVLIQAFETDPSLMNKAGKILNGTVCSYGDASVRLWLFPLIPVTYILYKGDDEFPMNVNILFDSQVTRCTHPEDVPVLGAYGASMLAETARFCL